MKKKYFILFLLLNLFYIYSLDYNTKIVVFCYHRFGFKNHPFSVLENVLKEHINLARKNGFSIISEKDLFDFYYNEKSLKPKCFLITVDDCYIDSYKILFSVLKEEKISGLYFLNTNTVDKKKYISWENIKEMKKEEIFFGSHSKSHFNYYKLRKDKDFESLLESEIKNSFDIINKNIKDTILSYAHPYGIYNPTVMDDIKNSDYKLVFTTTKAPNIYETDPLYLNRYVITKYDTTADIEEFLDYELLPIKKTIPENGDFLKRDKKIYFIFSNTKEIARFRNFNFEIDNKKYEANVYKNTVWFDCRKIKRKSFDISLKCTDK
ncbi:MAG: hypothetical protein A2086_08275, partial [Spirochaetes bacterium GWD1_27_9]